MGLSKRDLVKLGRAVAREQDAALREVERPEVEDRLAGVRARARTQTARTRTRALLAAALLAACFAAAFLIQRWSLGPQLEYAVDGRAGTIGDWVGRDDSDAVLSFSDGSEVVVRSGARARVAELERDGATLLVERGTLHVKVVHRDRTSWVIRSGPFEVHVIGTEFDLGWDADREELAISMTEGKIRVEGPCIERATRVVAAPERTRLACPSSSAEAAADRDPASMPSPDLPALPAIAASNAPDPGAEPAPVATAPSASAAGTTAVAEAPSWRSLLGEGKPREAFTAVEKSGLSAAVDGATGNELVELGSAARLAGNPRAAQKLYEAARSRFKGSDAAAIAAYHMGRMAFDGRGSWSEAERWFGVYLAERPSGALAPEALGRSIEAARGSGNTERARALAQRYLAAHPNGAHAGLAKKVLSEGAPDEGAGGGG
jgi:TolA-binding protein